MGGKGLIRKLSYLTLINVKEASKKDAKLTKSKVQKGRTSASLVSLFDGQPGF